jgi:hypothetical protein
MRKVIDITRGSEEELDYNDTEQDLVSKPSNKPTICRDIDKIGRKRENLNKTSLKNRPEKKTKNVDPSTP